jgi:very-short-patch-repair endonuclease
MRLRACMPRTNPLEEFLSLTAQAHSGNQLRERFGPSALSRACARGTVVRVLPNVYASTIHSQSFQVRAAAASLWANAPVSGVAALYLWGLVEEAPTVIEVLVRPSRKLHPPPWVRVRRIKGDLPRGVRHGVPVLNPAAAIVLGYGQSPKATRAEIVYGAVRRKLVGAAQIETVLAALPKVKARKALERSVRAAAAGAQSYLEERALYRVFNTAEFAQFVRQHEVVIEGNQFFLDMFDRATKTAIELDGRKGHLAEYRQKNIERDCWVATIGVLTLRFSYKDLMERPEWCRHIVREVLRARRAH